MQIARRIKEMRAEEALLEVCREVTRNLRQTDAAGVGGQDGTAVAIERDVSPEGTLDFQVLCDSFNNPLAIGQAWKIVLKVAGLDQLQSGAGEERGWPLRECGLHSFFRNGVSIGAVDRQIQQT